MLTVHHWEPDAEGERRRCPAPGCGRCLTLDARVGADDGVASAAAAGRALDVACACGRAFCFACLEAPHEPAPCATVSSQQTLHPKTLKLLTP